MKRFVCILFEYEIVINQKKNSIDGKDAYTHTFWIKFLQ